MIKHKMVKPYMECARAFAKLSRAKRKKVGAVAVTSQDLIVYSWNGTPSGDSNECEDEDGNTLPEVLHAESNLVAKAAREGISLNGATVTQTLSPCMQCAKQLYQSGVKHIIYDEEYRDFSGVEFLRKHSVFVEKYEDG